MIKTRLCKDELITKDQVKHLIMTNRNAVMHAAIFLYNLQTEDEQKDCYSLYENNLGFNRFDAYELSTFAEYCLKHKGAPIKEINKYRFRLVKYSQQIANVVNSHKNIQLEWDI